MVRPRPTVHVLHFEDAGAGRPRLGCGMVGAPLVRDLVAASIDRVRSEEALKLGGHVVWLFDHEEVGGVRQHEAFGVREP